MGSYARSVHEKMLANLTSLIWGSGSTTTTSAPTTTTSSPPAAPETTTTPLPDGPDPSITKYNIRAATPADEEEADWLLVDRAEVGEASGGEEVKASISTSTSTTTATTTTTAITAITTTTTTTMTSAPASSISPAPTILRGDLNELGGGQEWLMTPPPCFTRSQTAPLASSPLENLLIEHPSMSVYLPRPTNTATARIFPHRFVSHSRSSPSASPSSQPAIAEREESPMREEGESENVEQAVEVAAPPPPPPRTGVTHRSPTLLQAIDVLRPAQKAQRRRDERRLKRTPLERSNKTRLVAAQGNKRSKRCDMMMPAKFSRAVNNRKC